MLNLADDSSACAFVASETNQREGQPYCLEMVRTSDQRRAEEEKKKIKMWTIST